MILNGEDAVGNLSGNTDDYQKVTGWKIKKVHSEIARFVGKSDFGKQKLNTHARNSGVRVQTVSVRTGNTKWIRRTGRRKYGKIKD